MYCRLRRVENGIRDQVDLGDFCGGVVVDRTIPHTMIGSFIIPQLFDQTHKTTACYDYVSLIVPSIIYIYISCHPLAHRSRQFPLLLFYYPIIHLSSLIYPSFILLSSFPFSFSSYLFFLLSSLFYCLVYFIVCILRCNLSLFLFLCPKTCLKPIDTRVWAWSEPAW